VPSLSHDEWVVAALDVAFASLVTAHVTIVIGLARRQPRWRAALATAVAPLAPYWGVREGMLLRSVVWVLSGIAYGVSRWMAYR
jgi:hypothetical protein